MALCEAPRNAVPDGFVKKHGFLYLIHVDTITEAVSSGGPFGLCDGVAGLQIHGHDAVGNPYILGPCDWSAIDDPVVFLQRNGLYAQAQFIAEHPEVWPDLSEKLGVFVQWFLKVMFKDPDDLRLQKKRVKGLEEDYSRNLRRYR